MQIAKIQESLARKALYQPNTKFDDLFSLVAHPHWLWVATESILQSSDAKIAGIDGVTGDDIKGDIHLYAQSLAADLKAGTYKPQSVKRVYVPTASGVLRPSGVPALRDRVVQEATRMIVEPILESHFLNCSVGFRPGRRVMDAIHLMEYFASNKVKMWWIVNASIEDCYNSIPHSRLLGALGQYLKDKKLLALLARFLSAGVVEKGTVATLDRGIVTGGILMPLLLNIYLHEMDKQWWSRYGSLTEKEKTRRRRQRSGNVQFVRYADNFVVMTNGDKAFAGELRDEFAEVVQDLGLALSEKETQIVHLNDGFDFQGFRLQRVYSAISNKNMVLVKPTQQNITNFKEAIHTLTARATTGDDVPNKIGALNALVKQWVNYYCFANVSEEFQFFDRFIHMRMYYWLKAKHSNLSARESVKKHVVQTYLTQYTSTRKTWGLYGVKLVPITTYERKRYRIQWPEERNPYLEYGTTQMAVKEKTPLSEPNHLWKGHSEQSAYAVSRLERLAQVGYKCEECGSTEGYLHAHHVVPQREHGKHTVDNLRILCESCHIKTYSGSKERRPVP